MGLLVCVACVLEVNVAEADPAKCNAYSENVFETNSSTGSPWLSSADYRDAQCGGFVNKMNTYSDAERQFWSGLRVPSRFKEGTDGSGTDGMDNSDFAMICSHGWTSTSPNRFTWAMYHVNSTVHSTEMQFISLV